MSTLNVANISDGTDTVETGYVVNGSAKAWCYADDAASITESINISSGTDVSTGTYLYTYTNAFSVDEYSAHASCKVSSGYAWVANPQVITTTDVTVRCYRASTDLETDRIHMVTVHGDLA